MTPLNVTRLLRRPGSEFCWTYSPPITTDQGCPGVRDDWPTQEARWPQQIQATGVSGLRATLLPHPRLASPSSAPLGAPRWRRHRRTGVQAEFSRGIWAGNLDLGWGEIPCPKELAPCLFGPSEAVWCLGQGSHPEAAGRPSHAKRYSGNWTLPAKGQIKSTLPCET